MRGERFGENVVRKRDCPYVLRPYERPFWALDPEEAASRVDVARFVDTILAGAARDRGTEIRLEPSEAGLTIWGRFEGELYEMVPPPASLARSVMQRIKELGGLDPHECPREREGSVAIRSEHGDFRLRVITSPTNRGERIIVEILPMAEAE